MGERYRIEQVFGSIKRAYGSYVGCRGVGYALVCVGCSLVLWNRVQYLGVKGGLGVGGGDVFWVGVWVVWFW